MLLDSSLGKVFDIHCDGGLSWRVIITVGQIQALPHYAMSKLPTPSSHAVMLIWAVPAGSLSSCALSLLLAQPVYLWQIFLYFRAIRK